jgi:hypothetical protein
MSRQIVEYTYLMTAGDLQVDPFAGPMLLGAIVCAIGGN